MPLKNRIAEKENKLSAAIKPYLKYLQTQMKECLHLQECT